MGTIDLNHLKVFQVVAEARSFSAASTSLGMPKSSVSRAVAALEAEVGATLLHRTTREVSLTTAGAALFERVSTLLDQLGRSLDSLPERDEQPAGELRITAPVDLGYSVLSEVVARFLVRYPAITVDMWVTNRRVDLVKEGFDLAVRVSHERLRDSSLAAQQAASISMHLYAAPGYLAQRATPKAPEELASHDWVRFRPMPRLDLMDDAGKTAVVEPKGRIMVDDMLSVRELVRAGAGIGLLPTYITAVGMRSGELVRIVPRWQMPNGNIWILRSAGGVVPRKVTAFRDFVLQNLRAQALEPSRAES